MSIAGFCYSADTKNSPLVQQGDIISFKSDGAGTDARGYSGYIPRAPVPALGESSD